MKRTHKVLSLLFVAVMVFSLFAATLVSAAEYVIEKPVEASKWENANFDTDHAYSFAFVGDTQFITIGDYLLGTEKLKYQYKFIADTAEERKLEHVFVLGDMTDWGYRNDGNLASAHNDPPITGEWDIVQEAVFQLNDTGVTYNLVRGNHDDYMMDDYFNIPEYTDQFTENGGGFFSDSEGKHSGRREKKNPDGYIYWSAISGVHKESVVNSYMTREIFGTKYLFITYDYNPTAKVLNWMDELLAKYPDHKAIITTHSFMLENGTLCKDESGNTMYITGISPQIVWDRVLSKHENVFMIVSGHTGNEYVNYAYMRGDKGNKVLNVLVDPQGYETREINYRGDYWDQGRNIQDVGLVLYMNFSEDGQRISFNNYSTLLGKFLKDQKFVINLNGDTDTDGYIDMAGFEEYGQETPVIEGQKTVALDGVVNDGEYSYSRTIGKSDVGKGTLPGDLTEYFASDNDYVYYAFKTTGTGLSENKINIHFSSSLYNREQLNAGDHTLMGTFKFGDGYFKLVSSNVASTPIEGQDLFCEAAYDKTTKAVTYELKMRKGYLVDNGSPENLFSYTLLLGQAEHYFKLPNEAKTELEELGVNKKFIWTYNYVYFGSRPEPTEVPPLTTEAPKTEAPADVTTEAPAAKSSCGSSLTIAAIAMIPVLAGTAICARKRKDD